MGDEKAKGSYKIICQDGLEYMRGLGSDSVDSIITDPPYIGFGFTHENYFTFMQSFANEMIRCSRSERIAISQPQPRLGQLSQMFGASTVIQIPDAFEDERGENAFFLLKNAYTERKVEPEGWSDFAKSSHPNPRNVNKMAVLVKLMSNPGDTILDPFCGSGAIGLAAVLLNRHYIGVELSAARAEDARTRFRTLGAVEMND